MYNAINFSFASETASSRTPPTRRSRSVIQVFLCPSDGQQRVDPVNWGGTNYVSNSGTRTLNDGNRTVVAAAPRAGRAGLRRRHDQFRLRSPTAWATRPPYSETSWGTGRRRLPGNSPGHRRASSIRAVQRRGPSRTYPPS